MPLQSLIDKNDSFEFVRDQIALVLCKERDNQMMLAAEAGKDPFFWGLKVYSERDRAYEDWLNAGDSVREYPIVSTIMKTAARDPSVSTVPGAVNVYDGLWWIDVYGRGIAHDDPQGGHITSDEAAHVSCHRGVRLVRNILAASPYRFLDAVILDPATGAPTDQPIWAHPSIDRWEFFQPDLESRGGSFAVWGCRIEFATKFTEFSPEYEPVILEELGVTVRRTEDGLVLMTTTVT